MVYIFQDNAVLFLCVVFILGLLVGSFLNVVIYRLPVIMENTWNHQCKIQLAITREEEELPQKFNLVVPPSACPKCHEHVRAWQNIPVLSYLCLRGKCFYCKTPISIRYPLVELLTGLLFLAVAWHFGAGLQTLFGLGFTALLVGMAFIDADTQLLPDNLTLPLLWLGLLASLFGRGVFVSPEQAIVGAIIGYLSLWSVYWLFKLITHKEGMGYGDFKLLAALGAWLGAAPLLVVIILSAIAGLIFALISRLKKGQPMPFGPYLACAGWITFLYGTDILAWMYPGVQF